MSSKTIELIDPHEHAGRTYPPGSELTLDAADADWLVALKKARPVTGLSNSIKQSRAAEPAPTTTKESAT